MAASGSIHAHLLIAALFAAGAASTNTNLAAGAIVLLSSYCAALGYIHLALPRTVSGVVQVFRSALIVRLLFLFIVYHALTFAYGKPFYGDNDDANYDGVGLQVADRNSSDSVPSKDPGFYYLNAVVYKVFGHDVIYVRVLNALASALTVALTYVIALTFIGQRRALVCARILMFFPDDLLYSAEHLRDDWIALAIVGMFYHASRVADRRGLRFIDALCITGFGTMLLSSRMLVGLIVLLMPLAFSIQRRRWNRIPLLSAAYVLVAIAATSAMRSGFTMTADTTVALIKSAMDSDSRAGLRAHAENQLGNDVAQESLALRLFAREDVLSPKSLVLLPVGVALAWLMPFPPWKVLAPDDFTTYLNLAGLIMWYGIVPYAALGAREAIRDKTRRMQGLRATATATFITVILAVSGAINGGASRYRLMIVPFAVILACGVRRPRAHASFVTAFCLAIYGGATLAYLLAKHAW